MPKHYLLPRNNENPIYTDLCTTPQNVRGSSDGNQTTPIYCNIEKPMKCNHLIYAYMIENTGILEIFKNVLCEYLHGETLGTFTDLELEAHQWMRTTEELFYRDTSPYFVTSLTSEVRPQLRAVRRNAYYRMFGMDLN